jgi:hypothetical protein
MGAANAEGQSRETSVRRRSTAGPLAGRVAAEPAVEVPPATSPSPSEMPPPISEKQQRALRHAELLVRSREIRETIKAEGLERPFALLGETYGAAQALAKRAGGLTRHERKVLEKVRAYLEDAGYLFPPS